MRKSDKIRVVVCSVIVDIVAISAAMVIAYHLRVLGALFPYFGAAECEPYVHTAFVAFPIWLVSFFCARLYSPTVIVKWVAEFSLVSKASTFGVIILTLVSFVERRALLSRGWLLLVWALSICLVMIGRTLLRVGLAQLRCRRCFMSRILVVGANERAVTIARQFAMNPKSGATVVGVLDGF